MKIQCKNCPHSWEKENGDKHPYLCHLCGFDNRKQIFEQQNNLTSIWIKKIKESYTSQNIVYGFFGSTYNFINIFKQISKKNESYSNLKHRFFWNQKQKCWYTKSLQSKEEAMRLIEKASGSKWNNNSIKFLRNKKDNGIKHVDIKMADSEKVEIKNFWGKPNIIDNVKNYRQNISSMNDLSLLICPNCFTKLSNNNKRTVKNNYDNELLYVEYTCLNCKSKAKLINR